MKHILHFLISSIVNCLGSCCVSRKKLHWRVCNSNDISMLLFLSLKYIINQCHYLILEDGINWGKKRWYDIQKKHSEYSVLSPGMCLLTVQHWVIFLSALKFLSVYVNMLFIRKMKYLSIFILKPDKLLNALRKKETVSMLQLLIYAFG